jgi:alkaline phosphatase D
MITFLSVTLFSCSNTKIINSRPESNYGFSIIQGSTTETSTIIRVIYPKKLKVTYEVKDSSGNIKPVKNVKTFLRKYSEFKIEHIKVKKLDTDETYTLKINSDNKRWKDERKFRALDTKKNDLKILVASCMSDAFNEIGNDMWPKAFAQSPDVSFLIGDNLYADTYSGIYLGKNYPATPQHLFKRYMDHAMNMKLYRLKKLTPTYVTWDDHDYGKNDGGKEYPYKKESKDILNIFFPREKSGHLQFGPGVSTSVELGGMNFLFLDGRSFRSEKKDPSGTHFGKKQKVWIKNNLKSNKINWLISGDQFFGGYHPWESFQGNHPETFVRFLNDIKKSKSKVIFMSGDRHLVEVMKIPQEKLGYETYEYTISGIHTKMYPGSLARDPNPYRVGGFDGDPNFGIFRLKSTPKGLNVYFSAYSRSGKEAETNSFMGY